MAVNSNYEKRLATLEAQLARYEELWQDCSVVPAVRDRRADRAKSAAVAEQHRVLAMTDTDEQATALRAMSQADRRMFLSQHAGVEMLRKFPTIETQDEFLPDANPALVDLVLVDRYVYPARVRVNLHERWPRGRLDSFRTAHPVDVTPEQAARFVECGLGTSIQRESSRRVVYVGTGFGRDSKPEFTHEQWQLLLEVDRELATMVANKVILVEELSDDESRAAQLAEWAELPNHRRKSLPLRSAK